VTRWLDDYVLNYNFRLIALLTLILLRKVFGGQSNLRTALAMPCYSSNGSCPGRGRPHASPAEKFAQWQEADCTSGRSGPAALLLQVLVMWLRGNHKDFDLGLSGFNPSRIRVLIDLRRESLLTCHINMRDGARGAHMPTRHHVKNHSHHLLLST
jgi:hypothetical protein